jgi:hypothetical protein
MYLNKFVPKIIFFQEISFIYSPIRKCNCGVYLSGTKTETLLILVMSSFLFFLLFRIYIFPSLFISAQFQ